MQPATAPDVTYLGPVRTFIHSRLPSFELIMYVVVLQDTVVHAPIGHLDQSRDDSRHSQLSAVKGVPAPAEAIVRASPASANDGSSTTVTTVLSGGTNAGTTVHVSPSPEASKVAHNCAFAAIHIKLFSLPQLQ